MKDRERRGERRPESKRDILHLLVHSQNGCNGQGWWGWSQDPGALFCSPTWVAGFQLLGSSSTAFPRKMAESWIRSEQHAHKGCWHCKYTTTVLDTRLFGFIFEKMTCLLPQLTKLCAISVLSPNSTFDYWIDVFISSQTFKLAARYYIKMIFKKGHVTMDISCFIFT